MLTKYYFSLIQLFGLTIFLQSQTFNNSKIDINPLQTHTVSLDIFEAYKFNINQNSIENYTIFSNIRVLSKANIEAVAKSKLGKKYKWGGNGPYAYDCSGFTKEVFERNGITIPRVSKDQAKVGKKISKKNLQKGDLIFFDDKESSAVSHVGIYLGHGKFIHASKFHKQIVISPLREYRRFFKWGRRLS